MGYEMLTVRIVVRFLLRLFYGYRVYNDAVLKAAGPLLLIPNHVSWFDWLFIALCLDDDWRFVTSSTTAQTSFLHRWIMINCHTFPIDPASPYAVKRMAEFLNKGGRLVLFAEGRLSRTGGLMKLFDGSGFLLFETKAKVITAYLRGANRLPFCPHPGWRSWFPRVTVHFSEVISPPKAEHHSTAQAREQLTQWLRHELVKQQFATEMQFGPATVSEAIALAARQQPNKVILQDFTGQGITYRRLMIGAGLLAGQWKRRLKNLPPRSHVGVLLPNTNAFPVVLMSLWQSGWVPAILNYSTGPAVMLNCVQLAGLRQIITSRAFVEKAKLNLEAFTGASVELLYLEEVRTSISSLDRLHGMVRSWLRVETKSFELASTDTAVILFTSGSEGLPKGVELTHANLMSNIRQVRVSFDVYDTDRFFNALPLFHSFGLSVGLLLPLVNGIFIYLYPSPLHYRIVPAAVYNHDCTVMFGTNTFLNGYANKAHPYDFRQIRYLFAGAEKVQEATFNLYARKFGIGILEGYGATECSPVLSVNLPMMPCFGSAGQFLPGIEWKLEPIDGVTEGGRLFVRGPNIMKGYLNVDANATFQALGGWYDTGDIVKVDAKGFVHILGRLKRFAKVSGEMVSLTAVEDALAGAFPQHRLRCQVAVVSLPDEQKGEILIAVTNDPKLQIHEIREAVKAKGLSNLCVPRELRVVKEIPKLGTGKINHRELAKLMAASALPSEESDLHT
ncbi:acyl-(acyl-carrier-protein)-phospholipid O-acyltransferase / long-chain-fatty-acid--(acyl-carrier-protein) ligase [Gammaproteobacteria bacterium]